MDIFQGRISLKHKTIVILYSSQRSGLPGIYLHLFYIQKLRLSPPGRLWYILVKLSKQILINIPRGLILHSSYLNLNYSAWATKKFCSLFCAGMGRQRGEAPQAQHGAGAQECSGDLQHHSLCWENGHNNTKIAKFAPNSAALNGATLLVTSRVLVTAQPRAAVFGPL